MHTILVTEDDTSLRNALKDKLELEGFAVLEATTGKECLVQVEKHTPDLILLDLLMPDMDGQKALKEIRSMDTPVKDVPVIVVSNSEGLERVSDTVGEHITAYLVKSDSSLDEIVQLVRSTLAKM